MVKHLACYLTDHKQKSINSSWLEIAIWPQIWSLAPFILNVFKCPFKSLIWTPPHPHRPFSRREILNSAPSAFFDDCEQKNCSYIETYKFYVAWLLPNSQQQEEELPELSASSVVQTGGQDVEESRPAVVHVLVRGRKRGSGVHLRSPRTKRVKQMPAKFVD